MVPAMLYPKLVAPAALALSLLAPASPPDAFARAAVRPAAPAPDATDTLRRLCIVVGPLTRGLAEAGFDAYVTNHGRPDLVAGLVPFQPGWDTISEPEPTPYLYFQCLQSTLASAAIYADAADSVALLGLRRFEGLVVPFETGGEANSVASIYAGHGFLSQGYDPGKPCDGGRASMAAYVETDLLLSLNWPDESIWY